MAKDSLSDALFELKERERKQKPKAKRAPLPKRGRPKAFDSFYVFAQMMIAIGVIIQVIAFFLFT